MRDLETVTIDKLIKADWNYKSDGTDEQITKLMNSITFDNSAGVLAVRKVGDKLEVIDGNHRLEALRRLGWTTIQVENFGDLTKAKAIILARRRNHVWFDDDLLAYSTLFKEDVLPEIPLEELKTILPESEAEIDSILNLGKFDWEEPIKKEIENQDKGIYIKIQADEHLILKWQTFLSDCKEKTDHKTDSQALEFAINQAKSIL
jgi:hypothetical protein